MGHWGLRRYTGQGFQIELSDTRTNYFFNLNDSYVPNGNTNNTDIKTRLTDEDSSWRRGNESLSI